MENSIVRTKTRAEGGLTEEEKKACALLVEKWTKIAFRTDKIDEKKIVPAIKELYKVAGLKEPKVIIVPSPYVMAVAGTIASLYYDFGIDTVAFAATRSATDSATLSAISSTTLSAISSTTRSATRLATLSATRLATDPATSSATLSATRSATDSAILSAISSATDSAISSTTQLATLSATRLATQLATDSATRSAISSTTQLATSSATRSATRLATFLGTYSATQLATLSATLSATRSATDSAISSTTQLATETAIDSATHSWEWELCKIFVNISFETFKKRLKSWDMAYQGGNMWAASPCYIEACRDVLGLDLPEFKVCEPYEECAKEGGFRYLHSEFCLVCDFPEYIKINKDNQAHCDTGPSHRWRDGFSIWTLNGVQVEKWMVETPIDKLDAKEILKIENVDQRREVLKRLGVTNLVKQLKGKVLDTDYESKFGEKSKYELLSLDLGLEAGPAHFLKMNNISIDAIHVEGVPRECFTVQEALNWRRYGDKSREWKPEELT